MNSNPTTSIGVVKAFVWQAQSLPLFWCDENDVVIPASSKNFRRWSMRGAMLDEPHRDLVISHIRDTQQVIHLVPTPVLELGPSKLARMCEQLCGCLARTNEGLIQVFQEGFFGAG